MRRAAGGTRRGFTILEIITSLLIISIIGLAMTRLIIGQTRSFQFENGARRARAAARGAMNILITDLRMTQDQGGVTYVDATNNRRVDVRVPVVFGFVCEITATSTVIALVPADSFQVASAKYGGYAVRDSLTGQYTYAAATSGDTIQPANANRCHAGPNIYADTATVAGRAGGVFIASPAPPAGTAIGAPVFVWQTVTYEFKTSGVYSGRFGLYRVVRGRANTDTLSEELMSPFSTSARFGYYTNPAATNDVPTTTAPGTLNTIRGFQIYLPAESSDTMPTRSSPQTTNLTTAVFFKNTRIQ